MTSLTALAARAHFKGSRRKLVLAFDIGTTFSGISYSILDPGEVPEIRGVTRFPCQDHVGGDSKIPTIIYYDQEGNVGAVGAEAVKEGIEITAEDEDWTKVEWFKLHLRPKSHFNADIDEKIPPLPKNKTIVDLFADFMKYLYDCARAYIQDTHANGADIWASLEKSHDMDFVLTHPNGWEGAQQAQMRRAAVRAGLVPNTNSGRARIHFVTEGEASLHFCIMNGLTTSAMDEGEGVLIVDAGGGTVDLSAYGRSSSSFQEIAAAQCFFQGSVFVSRNAKTFLAKLLQGSKFSDDLGHIVDVFDKTTKLRFRNKDESQYVKFGTARDKDLQLGIRAGQLKLNGADVASFFEPSVNCIIKAIVEQQRVSLQPISSVFLVGGFAASDWLFSRVKQPLEDLGITFCRPDSHVNKAVANGGVSYFIDHVVTERVSRYVYGTEINQYYVKTDKEHFQRANSVVVGISGHLMVPRAFDTILRRGVLVSETREFRRSYYEPYKELSDVPEEITCEILCYSGSSESPRWVDEDKDNYSPLCTIVVQKESVISAFKPALATDSSTYYRLDIDIILNFGVTELTAQACWKVNGQVQRSPVEIVYDLDAVEAEDWDVLSTKSTEDDDEAWIISVQ